MSGRADKRKKRASVSETLRKFFEKVYFYSIYSLAIKAPYVLYFVIDKYSLLFSKANFGKSTPFPNGRASAFFSGHKFAYADCMRKARDARRASRLSEALFAMANKNFIDRFVLAN